MDTGVFQAGVLPGGLQSRNEIKILICYLVSGVGKPLTRELVEQSITEHGYANYFDIANAFSELLQEGHLVKREDDEEGLTEITPSGRKVAGQLELYLPKQVKKKALATLYGLLVALRLQKENKVEICRTDRGVRVCCHISGGEFDLMVLEVYVPDMQQAMRVRERFLQNIEEVYKSNIAILTGLES